MELLTIDSDIFEDVRIYRPIHDGIILIHVKIPIHGKDQKFVATNVPHFAREVSVTGYNFGYGGAGPLDLGLNIIQWYLVTSDYSGERVDMPEGSCFKIARELRTEFVEQFIRYVPEHGGLVEYPAIKRWIDKRL